MKSNSSIFAPAGKDKEAAIKDLESNPTITLDNKTYLLTPDQKAKVEEYINQNTLFGLDSVK